VDLIMNKDKCLDKKYTFHSIFVKLAHFSNIIPGLFIFQVNAASKSQLIEIIVTQFLQA